MARKRIVCIKRGLKHEDPYRHISQVGIGEGAGFSEVLLVEEVTQQLQSPTGDRFYVHGSDGREATGEAGAAVGGRAFSRAMGELAEGVIAPSQWEPGVDFSDVHGPDSAWFTGTSSRALPARPNTPTWEASPWVVFAECVRRAGTLEDDPLRQAAAGLDFNTFHGNFRLDPVTGR
jgi:hypothetical protein